MQSKRTQNFGRLYESLPPDIREKAQKQYRLFLEDPSHPSLRRKLIGSTRDKRLKINEVTVGMGYRATYFRDGDVYV
jgi:hypothetical protein